jgi:hypothetical protein
MMDENNSFMNVEIEEQATAVTSRSTPDGTPWTRAESGNGRRTSSGQSSPMESEMEEISGLAGGRSNNGANKKRKASPTELRERADDDLVDLAAKLDLANHRLRTAAKGVNNKFPSLRFDREMQSLADAVENVVRYANEAKDRTAMLAQEEAAERPTMVDASTDIELTPHWWPASGEEPENAPLADLGRLRTRTTTRRAAANPAPAAKKSYAAAVGRSTSPARTDDSSEGEEDFSTVKRRRRRPQPKPAPPRLRSKSRASRPPAVLIKVADGGSFDETLKAVRGAVDPEEMGIAIQKVAKTQAGHLLVEMKGGPGATNGAVALTKVIKEKAGECTGGVVHLGTTVEVEITDIDPCAVEEEVMMALEAVIAPTEGRSSGAGGTEVTLTGFWQRRNGTKIATAKIPRATAANLATLKVGWTMARVRPRRPEPIRCHRCLGFGHPAARCDGPDLTGKCRRCGGAGHAEKSCSVENACVACDRLGLEYEPHKTGSGGCQAKRRQRITEGRTDETGPTVERRER